MAVALAEANDLVLDGRAIARPPALNLAGIHGRKMHIPANDVVRGPGRAGYTALDLRLVDARGEHGERLGRLIARLHLHRGPVDRAAVEARRGAGLQASQGEAEPCQRVRQAQHRCLADAAGGDASLPDVDQPAQKRPGGEHDRAGAERPPVGQRHATDATIDDRQIVDLPLDHRETGSLPDGLLHRGRIECPIGLGPRSAHRRTLAAVEHTKLDAAPVRDAAHEPVERIDLADQVALSEPADRRIAGHGTDGREAMGDQRGRRAHSRSGSRRFASGVPATDDDDVEARFHLLGS